MQRGLIIAIVCVAGVAWADRAALSVDVGGGGVVTSVPAPSVKSPKSTLALGGTVVAGVRYGLTNNLEISVSGFFDPPFPVYQNEVVVVSGGESYPGTLVHQFMRFGATGGARGVWGRRFRFHLGVEAGWLQNVYSHLKALEDSAPGPATEYRIQLADVSRAAFVAAPFFGVEFVGDHWSVSVLPRAQISFGSELTWSVVLPLQFSWKWFVGGND